jgi:hypothetical protein
LVKYFQSLGRDWCLVGRVGWFVAGLKTGWSIADRRDEFIQGAEESEQAALVTAS